MRLDRLRSAGRRSVKIILQRGFNALSSYGFSCILFLFLFVLTYLGTIEQVTHGLYETSRKYFESVFLTHYLWGVVPVPLPGAYLLLVLLALNLVACAFARKRVSWARTGVLLAHAGILLLLFGAFLSFQRSQQGQLTLYENEHAHEFQSYQQWEIGLCPLAKPGTTVEERIISPRDLAQGKRNAPVSFEFPGLPIRLTVSDFARNARPQSISGSPAAGKAIDGVALMALPPARDGETNIPGAYVTLEDLSSGEQREGVLWGAARSPLALELGGVSWAIELRRQRWTLPFQVTLDSFVREVYPRTSIPKVFESTVTVRDGDLEQRFKIAMNEPLRYKGYTFFQSSWGPPNAGPNDRLYSTLAVVKNPAEKFPLYASAVISLGMSIHFGLALIPRLKNRRRRTA